MNASHHISKAELLVEHRRYDAAVAELYKALTIEPENALAIENLGWAYYQAGNLEKTGEYAHRLIACRPGYYVGYYYLALLAAARGNMPEARIHVQEALNYRTTWAPLYGFKGKTYLAEENWKEAEKAARAGLSINAEDLYCRKILNQALAKLNDTEKYDKSLRITLNQNPNDALTHTMAGWHELKTGSGRKANEHFMVALQNNPALVSARTGLAESVKAQQFLYGLCLRYDLWVKSNPESTRQGIMIFILLQYLWLGQVIQGGYAVIWQILLVALALPLLIMWFVRWLGDAWLYYIETDHRKYIELKKFSFKTLNQHGFSIAFFLFAVGFLWPWNSPVFMYAELSGLAACLATGITRALQRDH